MPLDELRRLNAAVGNRLDCSPLQIGALVCVAQGSSGCTDVCEGEYV
jgi:hypothetical protein